MAAPTLVTIIDKDPGYRLLLQQTYQIHGYFVETLGFEEDLREKIPHLRSDLIVFDPNTSDLTIRDLHDRLGTPRPVIVVSDQHSHQEVANFLLTGADDYIAKPFVEIELIARSVAIMRRANSCHHLSKIVKVRDIEIDFTRREVKKNGELVVVTRTEWLLLEFLANNVGRVLTKEEILTKVWGPAYVGCNQYLTTWVCRLRQKLGDDSKNPRIIHTILGLGLRMGE